jgi:hypothetical protein
MLQAGYVRKTSWLTHITLSVAKIYPVDVKQVLIFCLRIGKDKIYIMQPGNIRVQSCPYFSPSLFCFLNPARGEIQVAHKPAIFGIKSHLHISSDAALLDAVV